MRHILPLVCALACLVAMAEAAPLGGRPVPRFHTWYMINCEEESTWKKDFADMKALGFDCVALWNVVPEGKEGRWDFTEIVRDVPLTKRAIQAAHEAGLKAFLGIWNPKNMGLVPQAHRPVSNTGETPNRPNIYSERWQREYWVPLLQGIRRDFAACPGYAGIVFDDAMSCTDDASVIYSYGPEDEARFADFLESTYGSVASLNLQYHRADAPWTSFADVKPPRTAAGSAKLWKDWMLARGEWSHRFAAATRAALGPESEIIYIDMDYYIDRSAMTYGHDTAGMVPSFDRYGPYIAQDFAQMPEADLLRHVRRVIAEQRAVCPPEKLHFCTWVNGQTKLEPMPKELIRKVVKEIMDAGIHDITFYVYKVHDWRIMGTDGDRGGKSNRPPLEAISIKFNPAMKDALRDVMAESRAAAR